MPASPKGSAHTLDPLTGRVLIVNIQKHILLLNIYLKRHKEGARNHSSRNRTVSMFGN
jgi:hypothetical protein